MTNYELNKLSAIEQAATPAPWAYTEGCGAQVCVGLVHDDEAGSVRLKKGGFFLFEIEPDAYDRGDDVLSDDEREERALADAKLIALSRNYLPELITELKTTRARVEALVQENRALRDAQSCGAQGAQSFTGPYSP